MHLRTSSSSLHTVSSSSASYASLAPRGSSSSSSGYVTPVAYEDAAAATARAAAAAAALPGADAADISEAYRLQRQYDWENLQRLALEAAQESGAAAVQVGAGLQWVQDAATEPE